MDGLFRSCAFTCPLKLAKQPPPVILNRNWSVTSSIHVCHHFRDIWNLLLAVTSSQCWLISKEIQDNQIVPILDETPGTWGFLELLLRKQCSVYKILQMQKDLTDNRFLNSSAQAVCENDFALMFSLVKYLKYDTSFFLHYVKIADQFVSCLYFAACYVVTTISLACCSLTHFNLNNIHNTRHFKVFIKYSFQKCMIDM